MIYNAQFRDQKNKSTLSYVGYYQPHPHDNLMYLKLKFNEDVNIDKVKSFLVRNIDEIIQVLKNITKDWIAFSELNKTNIDEVKEFH